MTNTKRIRFIDSAATTTEQFRRHQEYEVDAAFADAMVKGGAAVPAVEEDETKLTKRRGKQNEMVSNHAAS